MSNKIPVITVDGPAGAGKSTVSCLLAQRLDYSILISGALYRSVAILSLRQQIPEDHLDELLQIVPGLTVQFIIESNKVKTMLAGEDLTLALQDEVCAERASAISQVAELRRGLLDLQRSFRVAPGLIADGRDMGTVVFPDAVMKIFLTASLEERARRRLKQLRKPDIGDKLSKLCRQLAERDRRDRNRSVSPLQPADDAIIIDTTAIGESAVVEDILLRL